MKSTKATRAALLLFVSLLGVAPAQADTSLGGAIHPRRPDACRPRLQRRRMTQLTTGDLNKDGYPDIAASHGYRRAGVYLQTGARSFAAEQVLSETWWPVAANIGATSIAAGDLDLDGNLDLVIPLYGDHYGGHMVQLYRGLGDGTFEIWPVDGYNAATKLEGKDGVNDGIIVARGAANPMFPLIADFNGDGLPDVAVSGNNGQWSVDILTQSASQQFSVSDVNPAGQNPQYMAVGDFNEDGFPDVVAGALYTGVLVFVNDADGNGTIRQLGGTYLTDYHQYVVVADFNGDGHQDIAARGNVDTRVDILYGDGAGRFTSQATFPASGIDGYLAAADIDDDGHSDLVVVSSSTSSVDLLLNDGTGRFGSPISTVLDAVPWGVAAADFDRDGYIDVAISRKDNAVQVLWNRGPQVLDQPNALAVSPRAIRLTWKDATGERGYRIQSKRGRCNSTNAWAVRADVGANTLTLLDTKLLSSTPYSYRVSAYTAGSFSEFSPCVSATTATAETPHVPVKLRAYSRSDKRIDLHWQDASENETAFDIYRRVGTGSWALLDSVSEGRQSYRDLAATGNSATVPYSYDVRACNASGCSSPNPPAAVPFRPSSLAAKVDSAVKLSWKDNSSDEQSFHVERRNGNCASDTPWSVLRALPPNRQAYTDASAVSGTAYAYRVLAVYHTDASPKAYGWSSHTGCVSATAP